MGSCGHVAPLGRNLLLFSFHFVEVSLRSVVVFVWNVVIALAEDAASFDSKTINLFTGFIL